MAATLHQRCDDTRQLAPLRAAGRGGRGGARTAYVTHMQAAQVVAAAECRRRRAQSGKVDLRRPDWALPATWETPVPASGGRPAAAALLHEIGDSYVVLSLPSSAATASAAAATHTAVVSRIPLRPDPNAYAAASTAVDPAVLRPPPPPRAVAALRQAAEGHPRAHALHNLRALMASLELPQLPPPRTVRLIPCKEPAAAAAAAKHLQGRALFFVVGLEPDSLYRLRVRGGEHVLLTKGPLHILRILWAGVSAVALTLVRLSTLATPHGRRAAREQLLVGRGERVAVGCDDDDDDDDAGDTESGNDGIATARYEVCVASPSGDPVNGEGDGASSRIVRVSGAKAVVVDGLRPAAAYRLSVRTVRPASGACELWSAPVAARTRAVPRCWLAPATEARCTVHWEDAAEAGSEEAAVPSGLTGWVVATFATEGDEAPPADVVEAVLRGETPDTGLLASVGVLEHDCTLFPPEASSAPLPLREHASAVHAAAAPVQNGRTVLGACCAHASAAAGHMRARGTAEATPVPPLLRRRRTLKQRSDTAAPSEHAVGGGGGGASRRSVPSAQTRARRINSKHRAEVAAASSAVVVVSEGRFPVGVETAPVAATVAEAAGESGGGGGEAAEEEADEEEEEEEWEDEGSEEAEELEEAAESPVSALSAAAAAEEAAAAAAAAEAADAAAAEGSADLDAFTNPCETLNVEAVQEDAATLVWEGADGADGGGVAEERTYRLRYSGRRQEAAALEADEDVPAIVVGGGDDEKRGVVVEFTTSLSSHVASGLSPGCVYEFQAACYDEPRSEWGPWTTPVAATTLATPTFAVSTCAVGAVSYRVVLDAASPAAKGGGGVQIRTRSAAHEEWVAAADDGHCGWEGPDDAELVLLHRSSHLLRQVFRVNHSYEVVTRQARSVGGGWGAWSRDRLRVTCSTVRVECVVDAAARRLRVRWDSARTCKSRGKGVGLVRGSLSFRSLSTGAQRSVELEPRELRNGSHSACLGFDRYDVFLTALVVYNATASAALEVAQLRAVPAPAAAVARATFVPRYDVVLSRVGEDFVQGYAIEADDLPEESATAAASASAQQAAAVLVGRGFPTLPMKMDGGAETRGVHGARPPEQQQFLRLLQRVRTMSNDELEVNCRDVLCLEVSVVPALAAGADVAKPERIAPNGHLAFSCGQLEAGRAYLLRVRAQFAAGSGGGDGGPWWTLWSGPLAFYTQTALKLQRYFAGTTFVVVSWLRRYRVGDAWVADADEVAAPVGDAPEEATNTAAAAAAEEAARKTEREWEVTTQLQPPGTSKLWFTDGQLAGLAAWSNIDDFDGMYELVPAFPEPDGYLRRLYTILYPYDLVVHSEGGGDGRKSQAPYDSTCKMIGSLTSPFARHTVRLRQSSIKERKGKWSKVVVQTLLDLRLTAHVLGETAITFTIAPPSEKVTVGADGGDARTDDKDKDAVAVPPQGSEWRRANFSRSDAEALALKGGAAAAATFRHVVQIVNRDAGQTVCWRVFDPASDRTSTFSQLCSATSYDVRVNVFGGGRASDSWVSLASFQTLQPRSFGVTHVTDNAAVLAWRDADRRVVVTPHIGATDMVADTLLTTWWYHRPRCGARGACIRLMKTHMAPWAAAAAGTAPPPKAATIPQRGLATASARLNDPGVISVGMSPEMRSKTVDGLAADTAYDIYVSAGSGGGGSDGGGGGGGYFYTMSFSTLPGLSARVDTLGGTFAVLTAQREQRSPPMEAMLAFHDQHRRELHHKRQLRVAEQRTREAAGDEEAVAAAAAAAAAEELPEEDTPLIVGAHFDSDLDLRVLESDGYEIGSAEPPEGLGTVSILSAGGGGGDGGDNDDGSARATYVVEALQQGVTYLAVCRCRTTWDDLSDTDAAWAAAQRALSARVASEKRGEWSSPVVFEALPPVRCRILAAREGGVDVSLSRPALPSYLSRVLAASSFQMKVNGALLPPVDVAPGYDASLRLCDLLPDTTYVAQVRDTTDLKGTEERHKKAQGARRRTTLLPKHQGSWGAWTPGLHARTLPTRPAVPVLYELTPTHLTFWWEREPAEGAAQYGPSLLFRSRARAKAERRGRLGHTNVNGILLVGALEDVAASAAVGASGDAEDDVSKPRVVLRQEEEDRLEAEAKEAERKQEMARIAAAELMGADGAWHGGIQRAAKELLMKQKGNTQQDVAAAAAAIAAAEGGGNGLFNADDVVGEQADNLPGLGRGAGGAQQKMTKKSKKKARKERLRQQRLRRQRRQRQQNNGRVAAKPGGGAALLTAQRREAAMRSTALNGLSRRQKERAVAALYSTAEKKKGRRAKKRKLRRRKEEEDDDDDSEGDDADAEEENEEASEEGSDSGSSDVAECVAPYPSPRSSDSGGSGGGGSSDAGSVGREAGRPPAPYRVSVRRSAAAVAAAWEDDDDDRGRGGGAGGNVGGDGGGGGGGGGDDGFEDEGRGDALSAAAAEVSLKALPSVEELLEALEGGAGPPPAPLPLDLTRRHLLEAAAAQQCDSAPEEYETAVECAALPSIECRYPTLSWVHLGCVAGGYVRLALPPGMSARQFAFRLHTTSRAVRRYHGEHGARGAAPPGGSLRSTIASWRGLRPPEPPSGLAVVRVRFNAATLRWLESPSLLQHNQVRYVVSLRCTAADPWEDVAVVRNAAATVEALAANTRYRVRVRTESSYGVGRPCAALVFATTVTALQDGPVRAMTTTRQEYEERLRAATARQYRAGDGEVESSLAKQQQALFNEAVSDCASAASQPGLRLRSLLEAGVERRRFVALGALRPGLLLEPDPVERGRWHMPFPCRLHRDSNPLPFYTGFHLCGGDDDDEAEGGGGGGGVVGDAHRRLKNYLHMPRLPIPTRCVESKAAVAAAEEAASSSDSASGGGGEGGGEDGGARRGPTRSCLKRGPYVPAALIPESDDEVLWADDPDSDELDVRLRDQEERRRVRQLEVYEVQRAEWEARGWGNWGAEWASLAPAAVDEDAAAAAAMVMVGVGGSPPAQASAGDSAAQQAAAGDGGGDPADKAASAARRFIDRLRGRKNADEAAAEGGGAKPAAASGSKLANAMLALLAQSKEKAAAEGQAAEAAAKAEEEVNEGSPPAPGLPVPPRPLKRTFSIRWNDVLDEQLHPDDEADALLAYEEDATLSPHSPLGSAAGGASIGVCIGGPGVGGGGGGLLHLLHIPSRSRSDSSTPGLTPTPPLDREPPQTPADELFAGRGGPLPRSPVPRRQRRGGGGGGGGGGGRRPVSTPDSPPSSTGSVSSGSCASGLPAFPSSDHGAYSSSSPTPSQRPRRSPPGGPAGTVVRRRAGTPVPRMTRAFSFTPELLPPSPRAAADSAVLRGCRPPQQPPRPQSADGARHGALRLRRWLVEEPAGGGGGGGGGGGSGAAAAAAAAKVASLRAAVRQRRAQQRRARAKRERGVERAVPLLDRTALTPSPLQRIPASWGGAAAAAAAAADSADEGSGDDRALDCPPPLSYTEREVQRQVENRRRLADGRLPLRRKQQRRQQKQRPARRTSAAALALPIAAAFRAFGEAEEGRSFSRAPSAEPELLPPPPLDSVEPPRNRDIPEDWG